MTEEVLTDDQSHYEVSLTAGQAFLAFVLLLLSLAASFAFGLLLGRGQLDERLTARKADSPAVVEAPKPAPKANEVVAKNDEDFKPPVLSEEPSVAASAPARPAATEPAAVTPKPKAATPAVPHFAQLLSTSDQKTAEALAAKLIDSGFTSSYVERTVTPKGTVYRVRIKFPSEEEAKSAEAKLKTFSKEVWITR